MKKFQSLFIAMVALAAIAFTQFNSIPAYATADSIVRNTNGFFAKVAADGKFYPAQLCYSTDGNQALIPCGKSSGGVGMAPSRLDAASTSLAKGVYTAFVASTPAAATWVNVYNGTAAEITLATGTVGNPSDKYVLPASATGWSGPIPLYIPASSALSLVAKQATVSSGVVLINLVQ